MSLTLVLMNSPHVSFSQGTSGIAKYGVSENGTLVFISAGSNTGNDLVWVDRNGAIEKIGARSVRGPASPKND